MKMQWILLMLLVVTLITGSVSAFSYHAPIEADNKLIILGESDRIICRGETCEYSFSITNNDSLQHTININPYLDSHIKEAITLNEILYEPYNVDYEKCIEYGLLIDDKNGSKYTACTKYETVTQTLYKKTFVSKLDETREKMPTQYLPVSTDKFSGTVEVLTTLQNLVGAGQTKYFTIQFSPVNKTGEFVVTAVADGKPSIKASLDPPYDGLDLYDDFEDNDYTNNPTWSVINGTWATGAGSAKHGNFGLSGGTGAQAENKLYSIPTVPFDSNGTTIVWWQYVINSGFENKNNILAINFDEGTKTAFSQNGIIANSTLTTPNTFKQGISTYIGGTPNETNQDFRAISHSNWYLHRIYIYENGLYFDYNIYDASENLLEGKTMLAPYGKIESIILLTEYQAFYDYIFASAGLPEDSNPFVLSVTKPTWGNYSGLTDLNFSVRDVNGTLTPKMRIFYSNTTGALTNLIYSDTNLLDGIGITCSDYDFSDSTSCGYPQWNTTAIADGNYFIDANLYNTDWNVIASSQEFTIDNYDVNSNFNYTINADAGTIDFNSISTVTGATINDYNWSIGGLDASTDENFVYTATEYEDINACLEVGAITTDLGLDINSFTCRTLNSGKYYGDTNFYFFDENTLTSIPATIDFNGTTYTGTSFYLPSRQITNNSNTNVSRTFTITKTGYSTRTYSIDYNQYSDLNIGFIMLADANSTALTFQLKQPTTLTTMANSWVTITKDGGAYTAYRKKTDATGKISMNLNPDQNNTRYNLNIVYGTTTYDWNGLTLTINIPLDEADGTTPIPNFDVEVRGVANYDFNNSTTAQTIILWTDLTIDLSYEIIVGDYNSSEYVDRAYNLIFEGLQTTDTLQPYLIKTLDASAIKFIMNNEYRNAIQDVTIEIYKVIGGSKVLVTSDISDATGTGLFWLMAGEQYSVDLTYQESLLYSTDNYVVTTTPVYFYFNLATQELLNMVTGSISLLWTPSREPLGSTTNITMDINGTDVNEVKLFIYNYVDGNLYNDKNYFAYTSTVACNGSCSITKAVTDFGLGDTNTFWVEARVYTGTQYIVFTHKYIKGVISNLDMFTLFRNARTDFGCSTDSSLPCPLTTIIAFVIALLVIGGIVFKLGFASPVGIMLIGLGVLTFFMWVGWFYWMIWLLMVIALVIGGIGKTVSG